MHKPDLCLYSRYDIDSTLSSCLPNATQHCSSVTPKTQLPIPSSICEGTELGDPVKGCGTGWLFAHHRINTKAFQKIKINGLENYLLNRSGHRSRWVFFLSLSVREQDGLCNARVFSTFSSWQGDAERAWVWGENPESTHNPWFPWGWRGIFKIKMLCAGSVYIAQMRWMSSDVPVRIKLTAKLMNTWGLSAAISARSYTEMPAHLW